MASDRPEFRPPVKTLLRLPALLALLLLAAPAAAQDSLKIAAVVNDDVISALDLAVRTRMAILSSRLQDTPETRARLMPPMLRSLIDERLKLQEARRLGVTVKEEEVQHRLAAIARQNNATPEEFAQILARSGILIDSLAEQIRAEVAWARLVRQRFRGAINISEEEIDAALAEIEANRGKPEYRVAEIFLGLDPGTPEAELRQSAERLAQQLREGASFAAVAQQFSQSSSAAAGGDLGWVRPGQLDPAIDQILPRLRPGEIAGPIRSTGGYYIIALVNMRVAGGVSLEEGRVSLKQAFLPLPENPTPEEIEELTSRLRAMADRIGSCEDFDRVVTEEDPQALADYPEATLAQLDDRLRAIVLNLPVGQPSEPVRAERGVGLVIVCSRDTNPEGLPSRIEVAERLARERLELLARGYLRDLRRAAHVDLRV